MAGEAPVLHKSVASFQHLRQESLKKVVEELLAPVHLPAARPWQQFESVNLQKALVQDADHLALGRHKVSAWASSWVLPLIIGVLTASTGTLIEVMSEFLDRWRHSYWTSGGWVSWSEDPWTWRAWSAYVVSSVLFATLSAVLVRHFAPAARGSGIPEVKTILGGFVMKDTLSTRTLMVKIVGLMLSVSSGLALGKEGPTVHIACCWANVCSGFSKRYSQSAGRLHELLSVASAAGVSVAFGAPVGGVLFSYEEVSTRFRRATMIRAFFAAVVAALTLAWYDPLGTGKLTLFEVYYPQQPALGEYPLFLLMGCVGGLVGALFVELNGRVFLFRQEGSAFRSWIPVTVEVALIAVFTALTSYPSKYTRDLSNQAIHALFHNCERIREDPLSLCTPDADRTDGALVLALLAAAAVRFVQVTITFGTGVPCGLFVPSLYVGACLGRCLGVLTAWANSYLHFAEEIHPGIYAMVGAAATLGGVCRVTISLVVIMYELTGGLYLTPAFMIAVLAAKWVGDLFNHSIYDCVIGLRGYPYLHEPCEVTYTTRACDVMQDNLSCLPVEAGCVGDLLLDVREAPFAGYPVVQSREDMSIMGYVLTQSLRHFLEESGQDTESERVSFVGTPGTLDASSLVDNSLLLVAPDTPASQIHNIFRQMGSKTILVTKLGKLVGLITKKSFLAFLGHSHGTCTATGAGPDDLTNKDPVPQIVIDSSTYVDAYHRQTSQDSQHSHGQVMARLPKQVSFSLLAFPQRAESLQTMRREVAQEMSYHTSMRLKSNCIGPSRKSRRFKLETISWPEEMRKSVLDGRWRWFSELAFLPALIGVVAAILRGVLLWCSDRMLAIYKGSGAGSFLYASLISVLFAELSATLGWQQPCSACGISEVKTILNGFVMEEILTFEMLLCRFLGLVFTTSARLCLDFVGVLVHLSACAAELTGRWCSVRNEVVGLATLTRGTVANVDGLDLEASVGEACLKAEKLSFENATLLPDASALLRHLEGHCDAVLEAMNGSKDGQPALELLQQAHAITASKAPVALAYPKLKALAARHGKRFLFESSVMDGVPIFSFLRQMPNVKVQRVMRRERCSLEAAVAEAQRLGIAEREVSDDLDALDGIDAATKLAVLCAVLFEARSPLSERRPEPEASHPIAWLRMVSVAEIETRSVRHVTLEAIDAAAAEGRTLKVVCEATMREGHLEAWIGSRDVKLFWDMGDGWNNLQNLYLEAFKHAQLECSWLTGTNLRSFMFHRQPSWVMDLDFADAGGADRRQLLSVACAAGIASAFGAPLGGVLWSYEQMSSQFTQRTLISSFLASMVADLLVVKAQLFHSRRTLFHEVEKLGSHYTFPAALDQAMFVLLGVLGGLVGACTVLQNMHVCSFRRRLALDTPSWKGRLSVAAIALLTSLVLTVEPILANNGDALEALFASCSQNIAKAEDWGFCQHGEPVASFELAWTLLKAGVLFTLELIITYDAGPPGGYLVPSLLIGACFGRGVHVLSSLWDGAVHPGVYAMVGAAAVLAGISRNHISLVVIMFELTGALQLVVPFMVAIMVANWVGNFFTCSLDEMQIRLRGYPLLDSKSDVVLRSRAQDIMDEELQCLTCDPCRLSVLTSLVQDSEYGGFPVVVSENNWTLLGYASRESLRQFLKELPARVTWKNPLASFDAKDGEVDLSSLVDRTVVQVMPEMRLEQVHEIFLALGAKLVLVSRAGKLLGLITKKAFVEFLAHGDIGNLTNDPAVTADPNPRVEMGTLEEGLVR
ncbi:H(+)/Cl(-) exchange transporter 5 (Chloride channel protein 5) (ClC-5) (Chloride transporter ClC-5) [Durusdinium trenchii]|uniref:homoserine dehydrogenase n=1 Tax=Durusdinium trenchii TaxID=1381693 RepID=A0ABP0MJ25_9DINO